MFSRASCKQPLRNQLSRCLNKLLAKREDPSITQLTDDYKDELVELIINDNLEDGCRFIHQEIQKENINRIKNRDAIMSEIQKRQEAMSKGEEYRDYSNQENFEKLPALLQPNPNGLTDLEFQVYKDFDETSELGMQIFSDTDRLLDNGLDEIERRLEESKSSSQENPAI